MNLKLSRALEKQIARVAKKTGHPPEKVVMDILEQELPRKELMADFVQAALAADAKSEAGGPVYRAEDVYEWMERLANGEKPSPPRPWRR